MWAQRCEPSNAEHRSSSTAMRTMKFFYVEGAWSTLESQVVLSIEEKLPDGGLKKFQ